MKRKSANGGKVVKVHIVNDYLNNITNFELDVAEYIEEAFERCGLEVRTGYDLQTAKRCKYTTS